MTATGCDAPSGKTSDDAKDDERTRASDTLRRLVRFLASALDCRYAFVSAPSSKEGSQAARMTLWLARDYGLRSEVADLDLVPAPRTPSSLDLLSVLRRAWPHEPDLAGLGRDQAVCVPLIGADGGWVGHLGILDPDGGRVVSAPAHLQPLARIAAAELGRWVEA